MTRRSVLAGRVALLLAILWTGTATAQPAPRSLVDGVDAIGMTVSDMDRAVAFYSGVLTFEAVSDVEVAGEAYERLQGVFGLRMRVVRLRLGEESIELTEYLAPRGRPFPGDTRANDRWFQHIAIVVSDMDRAYERLRAHKAEHASPGPQTLPAWNPEAGGIRAFYFRDPDGHFLEILQFPGDKGDARWHRPSDRLFLGIDHTAIVVADTDVSLRLYRDTLGLRVAGTSENRGPEQERLNNVFGARLRITTLRPASGPGIEVLEYMAPRDGRPAPVDLRANDITHWQTRLRVADVAGAAALLRAPPVSFVSPGDVALPGAELGFGQGLLVRDADGHGLQLVAP